MNPPQEVERRRLILKAVAEARAMAKNIAEIEQLPTPDEVDKALEDKGE